jgi:phosphoglycolate phosphatase
LARAVSALPAHIRAVLFDKDGTLVDLDRTWAGALMAGAIDFADGDQASAARLCEAVGWDSARGTFAPGAFFASHPNAAVAARWRALAAKPFAASDAARLDVIFAREILGGVTPLADLKAVTGRLRARGLALGVATNDSRASTLEQLAALGVAGEFAFVTGYDGPCASKPDPEALIEFAKRAGCRAAEIAVVGDSETDIAFARAGGAFAIAVAADEGHRAALVPLADLAIPSIDEL